VIAEQLRAGHVVTFRPHGHSMSPRIKDGQEVTVKPYLPSDRLRKHMVVLAEVNGHMFLHYIYKVSDDRVLIGNAHGHENGWTTRNNVFGILDD